MCREFPVRQEVVCWPEGNWDPHLTAFSVLHSVTACAQSQSPEVHQSSTVLMSHCCMDVQMLHPQKGHHTQKPLAPGVTVEATPRDYVVGAGSTAQTNEQVRGLA